MTTSAHADWTWIDQLPVPGRAQYPAVVDSAFVLTPEDPSLSLDDDVLIKGLRIPTTEPPKLVEIELNLATANILADLHSKESRTPSDNVAFTGRMTSLIEQFIRARLHLIGLQETRSKEAGRFRMGKTDVFASAARDGFSVSLWLSIPPYHTLSLKTAPNFVLTPMLFRYCIAMNATFLPPIRIRICLLTLRLRMPRWSMTQPRPSLPASFGPPLTISFIPMLMRIGRACCCLTPTRPLGL